MGWISVTTWMTLVAAGLLLAGTCTPAPEYADLAFRWAPILYQDTDDTNPEADFITRFDYDGDFDGQNNWDHFDSFEDGLKAALYYSVVETDSHWFINYVAFHPRDWSDSVLQDPDEHENDFEGIMAIVRKDGSDFGTLDGIVTQAHGDFFSYTPEGSPLTAGHETIDGTLTLQTYLGVRRPLISQEAKGHGMKAWPFAGDFDGSADQDGVIYRPAMDPADAETIPADGNDRDVKYRLLNLYTSLWVRQLLEAQTPRDSAQTFATWGTFRGDESGSCGSGPLFDCIEDAASTPWSWDDSNDGPTFGGEVALDPAHFSDVYFNGGSLTGTYTSNRYVEDLRNGGYGPDNLPLGWPSDLNIDELFAKLA
jgi:hypothetical protein